MKDNCKKKCYPVEIQMPLTASKNKKEATKPQEGTEKKQPNYSISLVAPHTDGSHRNKSN